uniref:Ig-like domain-containing protein n=1 Tax=Anas platyrhynchos TaxID=8839 RepID=A0A8B9TAC8_ANAPL
MERVVGAGQRGSGRRQGWGQAGLVTVGSCWAVLGAPLTLHHHHRAIATPIQLFTGGCFAKLHTAIGAGVLRADISDEDGEVCAGPNLRLTMAQTPREWEPSGLVQGYVEELGQRQNPNRFLPLWQEGFPGPHQVEPHRDTAWRGTKPLAMAPLTQALPLACLLLLLLGSAPGADAQAGFELHQPQKEVFVRVGETLTLSCTVTGGSPIGPVNWLKGWGSRSEAIYDQLDHSSRVMRAVIDSNTDFTILIKDVRPEDTGTYYCVKFRKTGISKELYRRGEGTVVLVQGADARAGQGFELHQPQKEVSVRVGETLTLSCIVTEGGPVGPVKWLKGWGSGSETIYDQKDSSTRGMRAVAVSNTDFTILISDVRPEDAGTYYCVKFLKRATGEELYRHGDGTEVVVLAVQARPSNPILTRPKYRVQPGKKASFTCKTWGFFPSDINVKWFKDKTLIQSQLRKVTPGPSKFTYNMSSTVTVTLQKDDIRSELTCQVLHTTLTAPLTRSYHLSQILRVPPSTVVVQPLRPVGLNETVSFTCYVQGFYPGSVTVTWLENGTEMNTGCTPRPIETPEGLFELRSTVAVEAVTEKNGSVFTCRVLHEGQESLSSSTTLWVAASGQQGNSSGGAHLLSSPGLWLCMLLDKAILGLVLFFLFKRWQA